MTVTITTQGNPVNIAASNQTISVNMTNYDTSATATAAAASATASAAQAALYDGPRLNDVASLLADTTLSYVSGAGKTVVAVGSYILTRKEGFPYKVAASGASDQHITTAGGVKLYFTGRIAVPSAFGCVSGSGTDDFTRLQTMFTYCKDIFIDGEYSTSDAIAVLSDTTVSGSGSRSKLNSTGTDKRIFLVVGRDNVKISGVYFNGNLTGVGSTGSTSSGGDAIAFHNCTNITVDNCIFNNIGRTTTGSFASCIWGNIVDGIVVEKNRFLTANGGAVANTGADINLSYYCKNMSILDNYSISEMDTFISTSAVGASAEDTTNIVVTGNRGKRSDASVARTGILLPYNAKLLRAVVSNNHVDNFPANGIYMSASADNTADSGGASITGNVIRFCGGSSAMLNISSGLYLSGRAGIAATGNVIEFSGYTRGGSARTYAVPGIFINGTTKNVTVTGNSVRRASGAGVLVRNISGSSDMSDVIISANALYDNARGGVEIDHALATATISRLHITENVITQLTNDFDGVTYNRSSGALNISGLRVDSNTITSLVVSTTKSGFTSNVSGFPATSFKTNHIEGWSRGISLSSGAIIDKEVGTLLVVAGNTFVSCATGIWIYIGTGKHALHFGTTFVNCTAETSDAARVVAASQLGSGRFEVRKAAAPTDGTWQVGDKNLRTVPAASGFIGDVCTTAGSPGTWKTYGAISA